MEQASVISTATYLKQTTISNKTVSPLSTSYETLLSDILNIRYVEQIQIIQYKFSGSLGVRDNGCRLYTGWPLKFEIEFPWLFHDISMTFYRISMTNAQPF